MNLYGLFHIFENIASDSFKDVIQLPQIRRLDSNTFVDITELENKNFIYNSKEQGFEILYDYDLITMSNNSIIKSTSVGSYSFRFDLKYPEIFRWSYYENFIIINWSITAAE